jgi:hypothetical protein
MGLYHTHEIRTPVLQSWACCIYALMSEWLLRDLCRLLAVWVCVCVHVRRQLLPSATFDVSYRALLGMSIYVHQCG